MSRLLLHQRMLRRLLLRLLLLLHLLLHHCSLSRCEAVDRWLTRAGLRAELAEVLSGIGRLLRLGRQAIRLLLRCLGEAVRQA